MTTRPALMLPSSRRDADPGALLVEAGDPGVLVEADPEGLRGAGEAPHEAGRVDEGDVGVEHPGPISRGVDPGTGLGGVEQLDVEAVGAVKVVRLTDGLRPGCR